MATRDDTSVKHVDHTQDEESSLLTFDIDRLKKAKCNNFSFLTVGKTRAGKSTLLNALTGTTIFKGVGDKSTTGIKTISHYEFERNGVTITAWDSPGFEDYSGKEEDYKMELKRNCSAVDLVLYCISMEDTRCVNLQEDSSSLKQITEALSVDVWNKSVFVFTQANKLQSRYELDGGNVEDAFAQQIDLWIKKLYEALRDAGVDDATMKRIPIVPAGHYKKRHLCGRRYWLSFLWIVVLSAVKDERAKQSLQKANEDRFVSESDGESSLPTSLVITESTKVL